MTKEKKLTENSVAVLKVLIEKKEGSAFAREVLGELEGKTFNSVNATLAALATKGLVTKSKEVSGEKFLTKYTATEKGVEAIAPSGNEAE